MASKRNTKKENIKPRKKEINFFRLWPTFFAKRFKASYFTTEGLAFGFLGIFVAGFLTGVLSASMIQNPQIKVMQSDNKGEYWMQLLRKSQKEYLYLGVPGDKEKSELVKSFTVKTGIPGERPTPLPQALGKKYWKIVKKYSSSDNPETAPYFLELDVPVEDGFFGPVPYKECNGPTSTDGSGEAQQCSWEIPGYFGLHGVNGDLSRLDSSNPGSSGCIRHTDEDITYLYNLLEVDEGIRYYIEDR